MDGANKTSLSDDEEDLEALRLAALQTLKKSATSSQPLAASQQSTAVSRNEVEPPFRSGNRTHGNFSNKRGRFYGGRGTKNGQFHGRAVSSNLISLTPSVPREELKPKRFEESSSKDSVLVLPQDRYNNKSTSESSKSEEVSTKFDRYKDSDKSDEEDSEDEALKSNSDDGSPLKLERSDSLEALMQELDDEIQGRSKAKDKDEKVPKGKIKTKRKKEDSKTETEEEKEKETESKTDTSLTVSEEKPKKQGQSSGEKKEEVSTPPTKVNSPDRDKPSSPSKINADPPESKERSPEKEPQLKKRRHSPPPQRGDFRGYRGKPRNFRRSPPLRTPSFLPGGNPLPFPPGNPPPVFTNPPFGPPNLMVNSPPFYERPLSPLLINAETLQTQTMAPLSPRSAAFVLENRAIIEKRKRSPRRSYSRSPSPRRRSLSPRRSLTPPRRRSLSPRKRSLSPRRRSLSPRKRSPSPLRKRSRSPKRRSVSPKRRSPSPKRRTFSPKQRPLSPKLRPLSPKLRPLSPKVRPLSPKVRPLSPRQRPLSPRQRPLSPRQRPLSPRQRPLSPKQRPLSPRQKPLSPKQRPLSPKAKPYSPKRRSQSPRRRSISPRRRDRKEPSENVTKNKLSIRERLGFKSSTKPEEKDSKEKPQLDLSPKKDDKPLDPVLEARKRKFETREIKIREGVIRLKPKEEPKPEKIETEMTEPDNPKETQIAITNEKTIETKQVTEEKECETKETSSQEMLNEDALLEDDELDLEAQLDLFTDEESGSDKEGRFKTKLQTCEKPTVLPFCKLVNGAKNEVKSGQLHEKKEKKARIRSRSPRLRDKEPVERKPADSSSPSVSARRSKVKLPRLEKSLTRNKLGVKCERHPKKFERKIEIKIKNPSKYERTDDKVEGDKADKDEKDKAVRKVELGAIVRPSDVNEDEDDETEIVVENDEDEVENTISNEGDLRAQLSKKRAEKLHKSSIHEGVTSRLLQNALQNALPIKKPKKSKSKELSSSDAKLPIHLRLGIACGSDVFTKPKKKSKKRKNIETEDQPQEYQFGRI